jgi:AraC-like DNA-binding protein
MTLDPLSEVLALCRSERAVTARFALGAPWALQSAGVTGALLRLSRGAPYWITLAGQAPMRIEAGDLVLLAQGTAHTIGSAPGLAATPFAQLIATHAQGPKDENPLVFSHGGDGAATDMFSALLWFPAVCRHALFGILPPLLHLRARELPITGCLATTMQSLIVETLDRQPGWRLSAARMGELLMVNILREWFGRAAPMQAGWLRGLTDPAIARAIARMHGEPHHGWTVEGLASEAAMSRSRFSARFKELVGTSPIVYLTQHRMALAAEQLEARRHKLAQIAEQAGYESEKVFARAFRRWSGLTPSAYLRREAEQNRTLAALQDR